MYTVVCIHLCTLLYIQQTSQHLDYSSAWRQCKINRAKHIQTVVNYRAKHGSKIRTNDSYAKAVLHAGTVNQLSKLPGPDPTLIPL